MSSSEVSSDSSSSLASDEFLVEKLVSKRIGAGGKPEYLIKWEGYEDKDNTWESPEDIHPGLVIAFEKEEERKTKMEEIRKKVEAALKRKREQEQVEQSPEPKSGGANKGAPFPGDQSASRKHQMTPKDGIEEKRVKNGDREESKVSGTEVGTEGPIGATAAPEGEGGAGIGEASTTRRYREVTPFF